MSITATEPELKKNLDKDFLSAEKEDNCIIRNGPTEAKLSSPAQDCVDMAESLFGILPQTMTLEQANEERLDQI